ncbi:hypothetical protein OSB04_006945 [Centaurea solstitialis]|uniref:Secreted protein n=1 Tax=Centaurea solstitialis TaxID=347529 RepID=A0AA38WQK7_9ASTR|nr:hypothetical protein OSB04_006945 [Centaurea solstitialis]
MRMRLRKPVLEFLFLTVLGFLPHCSFNRHGSLLLLQEYNVGTTIVVIADGGATLAVDTQHLRLNLRMVPIHLPVHRRTFHLTKSRRSEGILKARVGRNVDGIDLNLYHQSLKLKRHFQSDQISHLEPNEC